MKRYQWAFQVVMHHEGGFVDHSNDPGGTTNYGVSLRWLRSIGEDLDGDGDVDEDDIRAVTPSIAKELYRLHFWQPARCDEIVSDLLATKIFDMAVNMGQRQAYRLVQRAVNTVHSRGVLTVDGLVGPATLDALNQAVRTDYLVLVEIRKRQAEFYEGLIQEKPHLSAFRLGWRRRAAS